MPSIQRPLSGDVLVFDVEEERERAADPSLLARSGRNARTLLKSGPLRLTLVVVAPGGEIPEHRAAGPITIQPVRGALRFVTAEGESRVAAGEVLAAAPGVAHRVTSEKGATFLLTVAHPQEDSAS